AQCRINTTINWLERLPKQLKGQTPVFEKETTITEMLPRIEKGSKEVMDLLAVSYPRFKAYLDSVEDERQLY
ncbi:MAG: ATP-dependent DNA helicase DinG, partial [Porticoccaceae bacterium]